MFTDDDFGPDGLFGSRGITDPAVAEGAFFPYEQGNVAQMVDAFIACGAKPTEVDVRRTDRAPGIVMRRFAVPGAAPVVTPEMRPAWAIFSPPRVSLRDVKPTHHEWMPPEVRAAHVRRRKDTPEAVARGCTPAELADIRAMVKPWEWELTYGADHDGHDITSHYGSPLHVHVPLAKYLFAASPTVEAEIGRHTHLDTYGAEYADPDGDAWETLMYSSHARRFHDDPNAPDWYEDNLNGPGGPDWYEEHGHVVTIKDRTVAVAQRLSSHPMGLARIPTARRVMFALEGCLKEASLVNAGEATFSCPSVSLWNAPELDDFARDHLRGKTVFVVCDSDWNDGDHEQVTRLTLLARDRLRRVLRTDDVHATAPPTTNCAKHKGKHGVDDFLGHGGNVDDLVAWDLRSRVNVRDAIRQRTVRRLQENGLVRDVAVATWYITHADPKTGQSAASLGTAARNLRDVLGRNTDEAARMAVKHAVKQLCTDGILHEVEPIRLRQQWSALGSQRVWVGKMQVDDDVRAEVDLERVGDITPRS
jgi:hypothetical protein